MAPFKPTPDQASNLDKCVQRFMDERPVLDFFRKNLLNLTELPRLSPLVHSTKSRLKDPDHLRAKLLRKLELAGPDGAAFDITPDNLFQKITDLVGIRIIHLYAIQFEDMAKTLGELLLEHKFPVIEGPEARVWDDEYRAFFEGIGIKTKKSNERMYTSVHYVVGLNAKTQLTGEIQVRTLAEELWGEVDHTINYPNPSESLACREQIRVLARLTSGCTRLADSIFRTHRDES